MPVHPYAFETELPLLELVQLWPIPDVSAKQLLDLLLRAAIDRCEFDDVDAGRPGVLFDRGDGRIPVTGADLKRELTHNGYSFARLAEHLWLTRAAAAAFVAKRPGTPHAPFWAPEPPRPGRKVQLESQAEEIQRAFDALLAAEEVDFGYGGLRSAASALHPKFPRYKRDTIEKMIRPHYRDCKEKWEKKRPVGK